MANQKPLGAKESFVSWVVFSALCSLARNNIHLTQAKQNFSFRSLVKWYSSSLEQTISQLCRVNSNVKVIKYDSSHQKSSKFEKKKLQLIIPCVLWRGLQRWYYSHTIIRQDLMNLWKNTERKVKETAIPLEIFLSQLKYIMKSIN